MRRTLVIAIVLAAPDAVAAQDTTQEAFEQLLDERRELDRTLWAAEREAQTYEMMFVRLWDDLRSTSDPASVLGAVPFETLTFPSTETRITLESGIEVRTAGEETVTVDPDGWRTLLATLTDAGLTLVQSEWHHARFEPATESTPARSVVGILLHVRNADDTHRFEVTADLHVSWSAETDTRGTPIPATIETRNVAICGRTGRPVFETAFTTSLEHLTPGDDVIVIDRTGDGLSDIVYPPMNQLFVNRGEFRFRETELCEYPTRIIYEAVIADFTGDGVDDLLVAGSNPRGNAPPTTLTMFLYEGQLDRRGTFRGAPRRVVDAELRLIEPEAFAVGDVDGDGDLDVFVAQYMQPYIGGQFPTPYYDANDGLPAFLLLNDGTGNFEDGTEAAGLGTKRFRRTFRASFADLDADIDLDLVVVSDFAGVDVYLNDGDGLFTDVTDNAVDEWANFGMSHTFGDFNVDGKIDFYVTGMASTTARRLDHLGLGREDLPEYDEARMRIAYGNRMYLQGRAGVFAQPAFNDEVARSGWAWGCTTLDVENDGYPDIYITNGNLSGTSVQDYCTRFWCHDIYEQPGADEAARELLFGFDARDLSAGRVSWNGYEKNRLFLNLGGAGFVSAAWLMNVAIEEDSRAVIADDFDLDGRPDLLVISLDRRYQFPRRILRVMRNTWETPGHWIGLRLHGRPGVSPIGAQVTVVHAGGIVTDVVVTGDSAKSQHSTLEHFGLGNSDTVQSVVVRWPGGQTTRLDHPAIDTYHDVAPTD